MSWQHEFGPGYAPPSWVADMGGKDISWGNDPGGASFGWLPVGDGTHRIVLWVQPEEPEEREMLGTGRYMICVQSAGPNPVDNDVWDGDDPEIARAIVKALRMAMKGGAK